MNNNILIPLIISTISGISTFIGGLIIFKNFKDREGFISLALSFSLSVMISISVLDLLPNSFFTLYKEYGLFITIVLSIVTFSIGVLLVSKINRKISVNKESSSLYRVGVLSMLALIIHNFPEGIATFMTAYSDISMGISLGIAIMLHNIPEGISIAVPIYYATGNKKRGLLYSLISGLAEPLGAIMAYLILKRYINNITISLVLIFVAGIMISLAINEMLPESNKYNKRVHNLVGLVLGVVLVIINVLLF